VLNAAVIKPLVKQSHNRRRWKESWLRSFFT